MNAFTQSFLQYKKLWTMLFAFMILTLIMIFRAYKAAQKRNREKEEIIKKLDHLKMLRENYSDLTVEKIKNDESDLLLEGVASSIQFSIEKTDDMNAAFENLNEEKKMIYALNYFLEDGKKNVRDFFKEYQRPLTPFVIVGCENFLDEDVVIKLKRLFDIYDEDNEEVSFAEDEVAELSEELNEKIDFDLLLKNANKFIRENAEKFSQEAAI